ncbi:hypothetical protein BHECKSOX_1463 [Bathymodiolus heckerae thiotrophic gill symbiont]|nr:hypothetical protein BHECKSOX_1463 [Bathymodiolus heckerae thiotrophic gill symbiont]
MWWRDRDFTPVDEILKKWSNAPELNTVSPYEESLNYD